MARKVAEAVSVGSHYRGIPISILTATGWLFTCAGWKIHLLKACAIGLLTRESGVRLTVIWLTLPSLSTTAEMTTWRCAYFSLRSAGISGHSRIAGDGANTCPVTETSSWIGAY